MDARGGVLCPRSQCARCFGNCIYVRILLSVTLPDFQRRRGAKRLKFIYFIQSCQFEAGTTMETLCYYYSGMCRRPPPSTGST